jgi:hypothetical protein
MDMKRLAGLILTLTGLLLASCGEEKIEEQAARLRLVTVDETAVVLPEKGSAEVAFLVKDPDYPLNYQIGSTLCQVRLQLKNGMTPVHFRLSGVVKGETPGQYKAVIADTGIDPDYVEDACILLVNRGPDGTESYLASGFFEVRSEAAGYGVLVKTGLPTVYVDTEGGKDITSKEEYVNASVKIRGTDKYESLDATACQIRGRGNTTWNWPKKPYLVKLDSKQSVLGMPKHKRWVLLANFMDRTLMRNLVSMKVSSMTNLAWTPRCVPVELVLNGEHKGSYLLIEQVRVDKNRVNITEMKPEDNTGDALTGGYLLELDFHYDNEVQWVDPHGHNNQWGDGIPFGIKSPDEDDVTPQQTAYIKQYIHDAAEALYGPDFKDPEKGYAKYIDVDSFIDYWIVFEVMGNHELGNPGSVYMHKDRGGKLVAGPCWDFDWGVLSYSTSPQARTGLINGNAIWYTRLRQDPAFEAKLIARFDELLPQLETIPDYMDECEKLLTASAKLNFAMWNPAEDGMINGDERMSFHDAVSRLKSIFKDRLRVIPSKL